MVEGRKRAKSRSGKLMGSHQRCWIWGRHAVLETLRGGRWPIRQLHLSEQLPTAEANDAIALAERSKTPVIRSTPDRVTQLCRASDHQGYAAQMPPFPYVSCDVVEIGPSSSETSSADNVLVVLDGIQDPFNFGAIIRSAEVLGFRRIVVGERSQAEINSHVVRSSAGAINHVDIARTSDLGELIGRCRQAGFRVVGTDQHAVCPVWSADLSGPLVVIIGSEGAGMSPELRAHCETFLAIPRRGSLESLNAAVATGIVLYEISRQQQGGRPWVAPS